MRTKRLSANWIRGSLYCSLFLSRTKFYLKNLYSPIVKWAHKWKRKCKLQLINTKRSIQRESFILNWCEIKIARRNRFFFDNRKPHVSTKRKWIKSTKIHQTQWLIISWTKIFLFFRKHSRSSIVLIDVKYFFFTKQRKNLLWIGTLKLKMEIKTLHWLVWIKNY